MSATMSVEAIRDGEGDFVTNGPVIFADNSIMDGGTYLWNVLAYDRTPEGYDRYSKFHQALLELVREIGNRKISGIKMLRAFAIAFGHNMNLIEAKETYEAGLDLAIRDAQEDLRLAFARHDAVGVERAAGFLRSVKAPFAPPFPATHVIVFGDGVTVAAVAPE